MRIKYSEQFLKHFNKRVTSSPRLLEKFNERIALFQENPADPLIRDHKLRGNKAGCRSFSITGDIRVIYIIEDNIAYFLDIGTHNQVY